MMIVNKIFTLIYSRIVSARFNSCGRGSRFHFPALLVNPRKALIGKNVTIATHCFLNCGPFGDGRISLKIGSGSNIGRFAHINAYQDVTIEDDVLIAERVHISDVSHIYADNDMPIMRQGAEFKGAVVIGKGSWIGSGAVILPNVKIGRNAVVGANAVVTKDVPDNCVARGVPAGIFPKKSSDTR
jgi:acetyltransferase-like isoleucine patch superfamily enzyme